MSNGDFENELSDTNFFGCEEVFARLLEKDIGNLEWTASNELYRILIHYQTRF